MSKEADASCSPRNTAAWAVSASQGAELRQMCALHTRWGEGGVATETDMSW